MERAGRLPDQDRRAVQCRRELELDPLELLELDFSGRWGENGHWNWVRKRPDQMTILFAASRSKMRSAGTATLQDRLTSKNDPSQVQGKRIDGADGFHLDCELARWYVR
jgi:hypothetical protein